MAQSTVFPIFLRAEYREGQLQGFISDAKRSADLAKAEFRSVGAVLDEALSRKRNASGSLDLGIDELKAEAAAQRARAIAAREVAEATARLAPEQAKAGVSLRASAEAAKRYASETDRLATELEQQVRIQDLVQQELNKTASATDAVVAAQRRGTTARGNVINSVGSERTAFIQLGQQLQDMTVQAQMGTNAFIIMGQQLPQVAFALSGLEGSANKTKAAVGRFATFLAGPWGSAVFVALAVLGPFVQKLFESEKAADDSSRAQRALAEVLRDTTSSYEEVTRALNDYNRAQERSQEVTLLSLSAQAAQISANLRVAASVREKIKADLELFDAQVRAGPTGPGGQGQIGAAAGASVLAAQLADQDAQIAALTRAAGNTRIEVATEIARVNSDASAKIKLGFDVLRKQATDTITDVNALADRLTSLNRQERAALDAERKSNRPGLTNRSGAAAERSRIAAANQLANFSEKAAEQIQRINERFDEQPRLIDQASQATRQLDGIIAELAERKPVNFEQMIADAEDAKLVIQDALQRPVEDILRRSEERLAVERLIAQGRIDEVVALQEIVRLEEQFGIQSQENLDRIREQILFEQQRSRELRAQAELMELQADVARTMRESLTNIFSGRGSFGDLIRNFRQSLQDLQGARIFEDLFGDSFRQLEEELRGNTPQGRANARFTAEVGKAADTTAKAVQSVQRLSDAFEIAADRISGRAANDNGSGFALGSGAGRIGSAAIGLGPGGGIVVTANADKDTTIARKSVVDIAKEIGDTVGMRFASVLEDVLSPQQLQLLGQTIGGFIAGKALGGTTGGILGALEGLTSNIKGLEKVSAELGKGLEGAARGTQVNAGFNALGIKGSQTGAQIGGALGNLIPGLPPGIGSLVGSVLGNVVGGLLKSPKRGSATIGGVGGSLGITGTVGNSRALRDAATGLAGSVLDSVNDIARQLGASVDASRGLVSIGQRKDNLRVDPTGRGATKIGNGAIDFGQDAEAAIAFAVRNLIQDGVITGLRAAEERLLRAGNDINAALQDVLTFRSVFDRLKEIKDPVGFAVDQLNREFTNLIDLFTRAGASAEEFAQLEELYGLERARAIEEATERTSDALKQLLADLRIGDSGLSLRTRRGNALTEFNALAARVQAGDSSAFDDFAEISQQLLEIERQLFGSTQSYFDRLAQITNLTEQAIAGQGNVTGIGADLPSPFDERNAVVRSVETIGQRQIALLEALNDNIIALNPRSSPQPVQPGFGGGSNGVFDTLRLANF